MPLSASVSTLEDLCSRHILSMLLFLSREDETKEWEPPENGTEANIGGEDAEDVEDVEDITDAEDVEKKRKGPPLDQRDLSAKALARMAFVHGFLSSGALEVLFEHCFNIYQLPIQTSQPSFPSSIGPLGKKVCVHQRNDNNSAPWTDDDNDTSTNSGSNSNIIEGQSFVQLDIGNEDHRVLSGNDANEDNRLPGEAPWAFNTIGRPPDRRSFVLESNIRCVDLDVTWTLLNVFLVPHQHRQPHGARRRVQPCS
ncbi:uncharacterized protein LOC131886799 [Tigriopus californicus]|uniref:uncharacterized protein LOC131886799 n=1 Tax=Tigriopus californicus TaxID=6832 RepID=UPI0027D9D09A|nr:uncharacterized protein LOC131886799 [Tigriopus californicus]